MKEVPRYHKPFMDTKLFKLGYPVAVGIISGGLTAAGILSNAQEAQINPQDVSRQEFTDRYDYSHIYR